jgi:hypothetical protein
MEHLEPRLVLAGDLLASSLAPVHFETFDQSMWGPNGPAIIDSGLLFAGAAWDVAASPRLTDPITGSFIELNASTSGNIGIDFQAILDPGSIDASYGAQARLEVIEGEGNTFTINSYALGSPTGSLETRSPNVDIESNFIFDVEAALGIRAEIQTPDITITVPTVHFENRILFPGTIFQTTIPVPIFGTRTLTLPGVELASFNEEIISLDIADSMELLKITNQEIRIVEQIVAAAEEGENLKFTFDLGFDPLTGLDVSSVEEGNPNKQEKPHDVDPFDFGVSFSMGDITVEVATLNLAEDTFTTDGAALGLRASGATNLARIDIDADFLASVLFGLPPLGATAGISIGPVSLFEFAYDLLDVDIGPQFSIGQDFEFLPELLVTMGFDQPVVINGQEVHSHTMPVGSSVNVEFAGAGAGDDLGITTSYTLANQFRNKTELLVAPSIDFLVLSASFETFLGPLFDAALFDPPAITGPAATLATLFNQTYTLGGFGTVVGETLNIDFNQPPEINPQDLVLAATTEAEGSPVLLSGSFIDPDSGQTHTVLINWGDGTAPTDLPLAADVKTFTGISHTYADDSSAPYTITVTVTDDDGESDDAQTSVTVVNIAPTLVLAGAAAVAEGSEYTLNLSDIDPGDDTISGWVIDWGDGQVDTVAGDTSSNTHTYADGSQVYSIHGTATDEDGTYNAAASVEVTNVAPTLTINGAASVDEGSLYTLRLAASDAGDDTISQWTIDWGDGHIEMAPGEATAVTHIYADGISNFVVRVAAMDEDGAFDALPLDITVTNVAPDAALTGSSLNLGADGLPIPFSGVRGQTLHFGGPITDPGFDNPADSPPTHETFTYVIDWGDGSTTAVSPVSIDSVGSPNVLTAGSFAGSHVYASEGTYAMRVTVRDDDGGETILSQDVTIAIAAQQVGGELAVGGTTGDDRLRFNPTNLSTQTEVELAGVMIGAYHHTGRLLVFGQAGDDDIHLAGSFSAPAWLDGGPGNDRLKGGAGHDVLIGGDGDDLLIGQSGRDLLIGGNGADRIVGNADDDILIAGRLMFGDVEAAIAAIMKEWTSAHDYVTRAANLNGLTERDGNGAFSSRLNGNYFLTAGESVLEDDADDKLTGSSGDDWFFFDPILDRGTDLNDEIFANDLSFILA